MENEGDVEKRWMEGEMVRWIENGGEWEMIVSGMVEGGRNCGGR